MSGKSECPYDTPMRDELDRPMEGSPISPEDQVIRFSKDHVQQLHRATQPYYQGEDIEEQGKAEVADLRVDGSLRQFQPDVEEATHFRAKLTVVAHTQRKNACTEADEHEYALKLRSE